MKPRRYATSIREDIYSPLYLSLTRHGFVDGVEPLPISVRSRHEQDLQMVDEQNHIVTTLRIVVPGFRRFDLPWGAPFHSHPLIEYAARHYCIEQIERLSLPSSLRRLRTYLKELKVAISTPELEFTEEVERWISASGGTETRAIDRSVRKLARTFAEFCVDREYWGFPDYVLCTLPTGNKSKLYRTAESLFDRAYGPFTQEEIIFISESLNGATEVPLVKRAIALVMRDWGARPIQVALLREADLEKEHGQFYLNIPSVKGAVRSRLRRLPTNMKRRPISEDTAEAIGEVICRNRTLIPKLKRELAHRYPHLESEIASLPSPMFPPDSYQIHMGDFLTNGTLREFALHSSAPYISTWMAELTRQLNIPQVVTIGSERRTQVLRVSAARFRKTKATLMVIQGYSPDEVAEALDHADTNSLRHYFKFNRDVIDYVNAVQSASPAITGLVRTWVEGWKKHSAPTSGTDIRATATNILGKCGNDGICDRQPTVSCYSCFRFRPSIDADHAKAAAFIDNYASTIGANSTGPVRDQLILASANAHKLANEQAKVRSEAGHDENTNE